MIHTNARFSLHDNVLTVLYVSLLQTVLNAEGYTLRGYSGSPQQLQDPRKRISPEQYLSILEQSLKPTAAIGLGFNYGKMLDMAGAGTVGQLFMSCANLEEAFQNFLKYYPLLSLSMQFDVSWQGDLCTVEVDRICNDRDVSRPVQWLLTESLFYCWINQCRWLSGKPLNYRRATFTYPRPPHARLYETLLGCEIEFDAPVNSITVDRDFFSHKISTANHSVQVLKERHCREVLMRWQSMFSIREQINTTLTQALPNIPSLEAMADHLNLSRSSLYRKLRDAECSYQALVDNFRRDQAVYYLKNTDVTICEIAEQLGFSDASNFRRAFKKWTGYKPSDLRRDTAESCIAVNSIPIANNTFTRNISAAK